MAPRDAHVSLAVRRDDSDSPGRQCPVGLPIQGVPVGGISDPTDEDTINARLDELLGATPDIRDNGGRSKYCLNRKMLRDMFAAGIDYGSTPVEVQRYS